MISTGLLMMSAFLLGNVAAQSNYPNKPITVIVPYAPGGQGDMFARAVGERLTRSLGQTVLVDNKPGASGALGARLVSKARGDGYTLITDRGRAPPQRQRYSASLRNVHAPTALVIVVS